MAELSVRVTQNAKESAGVILVMVVYLAIVSRGP
jgi:hypothetical protein